MPPQKMIMPYRFRPAVIMLARYFPSNPGNPSMAYARTGQESALTIDCVDMAIRRKKVDVDVNRAAHEHARRRPTLQFSSAFLLRFSGHRGMPNRGRIALPIAACVNARKSISLIPLIPSAPMVSVFLPFAFIPLSPRPSDQTPRCADDNCMASDNAARPGLSQTAFPNYTIRQAVPWSRSRSPCTSSSHRHCCFP